MNYGQPNYLRNFWKEVDKIRLNKIQLSWFRGAAEDITLNLDSKNVVVYGPNGSGKSSFVDAVEYIINNGKIRHLSHEYSGRRQEKGILNTHIPKEATSRCAIYFDDNSYVSANITANGSFVLNSEPPDLETTVQNWALENHLLRQDEASEFIYFTKGQKYSVLLPLLGLDDLEYAAENLKQLKELVVEQSKIEEDKAKLTQLINIAKTYFLSLEEKDVLERLCELSSKYTDKPPAGEISDISKQLLEEINQRINSAEPENNRYIILKQILGEELNSKLENMILTREKARGEVDTLLDCRIAVLESTLTFTNILEDLNTEISCPSCGQKVKGRELEEHVERELERMKDVRKLRDTAIEARDRYYTSLKQAIERTRDPVVLSWLELIEQKELADTMKQLDSIRIIEPDDCWKEEAIMIFKGDIPKLVDLLSKEIDRAPPPFKKLIDDRELVSISLMLPDIVVLQDHVSELNLLIKALENGERLVRDEINNQAFNTIKEISAKIQYLWAKLHPGEPIEEAHLYIPADTDKAIDIGLKFFGVDQPSPRLTLSESHRNCLGLCIFLALALLRTENHPIILDDIISSLDREHRGWLVDIIIEDLADRQVILFTHDRDWYTELRYRLPITNWKFMVLRPWENPSRGIQWSSSIYTFDDAHALLPDHPEASGNRVRAIMDGHLALATEELKILMPYLRGDRNDRRTCIDFLNRIIGEAPKRLKKKQGDEWLPYPDPISDWKATRDLLIAWGDPASHTGTLTPKEAERMIEVCENALNRFKCLSCGDYLWRAEQSERELLQCPCGQLQWRYG